MKQIAEWAFARLGAILLVLGLISLAEVICIKGQIGIQILSGSSAEVIYDLSLSYFSAYLFYLLIVYLPEKRNSHYRIQSAYYFVFTICNCIDSIVEIFVPTKDLSKLDEGIWEEKLKDSLNEETYVFFSQNIHKQYSRVIVTSQFIDPKTMLRVDNIVMWLDFIMIRKDIEIEGGTARSDINALRLIYDEVCQIRREEKVAFAKVESRLMKIRTE